MLGLDGRSIFRKTGCKKAKSPLNRRHISSAIVVAGVLQSTWNYPKATRPPPLPSPPVRSPHARPRASFHLAVCEDAVGAALCLNLAAEPLDGRQQVHRTLHRLRDAPAPARLRRRTSGRTDGGTNNERKHTKTSDRSVINSLTIRLSRRRYLPIARRRLFYMTSDGSGRLDDGVEWPAA